MTSRPGALVVVAGTATEVGKTWVAARLLERWRRDGLAVAARKPAQSFTPGEGPTDAEVLAAAGGGTVEEICRAERSYPVALAPPMAARELGRAPVLLAELCAEITWPEPPPAVGLVETAGGLRSPQAEDGDALDLAARLAPDLVVLVADAGLGTINAVRLCAGVLAASGLPFVVVLDRYDSGVALHGANLAWLRDRDGIDVLAGDDLGLDTLAGRAAAAATAR